MPCATAHTISLQGALGHLIDVQADVSPGQVGTTLVGRPDASLYEARDRCRMAIVQQQARRGRPRKRITILLSPADLLKSGTHFDLAIAVSVLAADGRFPGSALDGTVFIGELTLTGGLRSVPGVLPMVMAASARGIQRVFVPEPQAREAAMVPGMEVLGMRSLAQIARRAARRGGARGAAGGADVGEPAARLARPGADGGGGHGRPPRHAGREVRRRGRRRRRPPPDALRAQGRGQDHAGRADPGHPPRPDPSTSRSS